MSGIPVLSPDDAKADGGEDGLSLVVSKEVKRCQESKVFQQKNHGWSTMDVLWATLIVSGLRSCDAFGNGSLNSLGIGSRGLARLLGWYLVGGEPKAWEHNEWLGQGSLIIRCK